MGRSKSDTRLGRLPVLCCIVGLVLQTGQTEARELIKCMSAASKKRDLRACHNTLGTNKDVRDVFAKLGSDELLSFTKQHKICQKNKKFCQTLFEKCFDALGGDSHETCRIDYAHEFLTDTGHAHYIFRNYIYKTHTATGFEYTKNWERYERWQPGSDNQQSPMISDKPTGTGMCVCKSDNCDQRIYRQILQDLLAFKTTFRIDHKNVLESMQKFCKEGYITKTLSPVELLLAALSIALTMVLFVMEFCFYGPSKRFYQTLAKIDPCTPETRENVGMLNVCLGTSCLGAFRDLGRKAFERRFAGDVQTKGWLFQPCESDRGSYASSRGKQPTIEFPRSPSRGTGEMPSIQMVGYNH